MEKRKSKRFAMALPLSVIKDGADLMAGSGQTKNVSSGGVLFRTVHNLGVGGSIEYVLTLPPTLSTNVSIRCQGKVLRNCGLNGGQNSFEIAASLDKYEFHRSDEE